MSVEDFYDAIIERININKDGHNQKYYFILWAVFAKIVGLFVILSMMLFFVLDIPQVIQKEIASRPTRPAPVFTETIQKPTQTETIQATQVQVSDILQIDVTPEPVQIIEPTPTMVLTISRFDPSDAAQNSEIGIPLSGLMVDELPLVISQDYNVINEHRDMGHHGVDFGFYDYKGNYILDLPINAIFGGTVAGIIHDKPPLGHAVMVETPYDSLPTEYCQALNIQPGESLYILYAHMIESPRFLVGDAIAWQQQIGNVGKSQTAEAHLHLETRVGASGFTFYSMAYYDTAATDEEMETYVRWRTSGDFRPFDPMKLFTEMYHE